MMYSVKYKKIGSWFYKKLANIKGDGLMFRDAGIPYRFFIINDETRIEIPMNDMIFVFSKERFITIKTQMESQVGQKIPVNSELES